MKCKIFMENTVLRLAKFHSLQESALGKQARSAAASCRGLGLVCFWPTVEILQQQRQCGRKHCRAKNGEKWSKEAGRLGKSEFWGAFFPWCPGRLCSGEMGGCGHHLLLGSSGECARHTSQRAWFKAAARCVTTGEAELNTTYSKAFPLGQRNLNLFLHIPTGVHCSEPLHPLQWTASKQDWHACVKYFINLDY